MGVSVSPTVSPLRETACCEGKFDLAVLDEDDHA